MRHGQHHNLKMDMDRYYFGIWYFFFRNKEYDEAAHLYLWQIALLIIYFPPIPLTIFSADTRKIA